MALHWLDATGQDLRYAVRMLRRSPGFTTAAVLSLALGIGASTAIFSLIESALLRPISVKHLDGLRLLQWREQWGGWVAPNLGYMSAMFGSIYEQQETRDGGIVHTDFAPPVYRALAEHNDVFDSFFTFKELGRATLVAGGNAEAVNCFLVSDGFYRGLEVSPVIGRAIGPPGELGTEGARVALISYSYWTRRFGRDPSVIGKQIELNGVPVTIIGVNPEYFTGIEPGSDFEVWAPLELSQELIGRSFLEDERAWQLPAMGRLKPGVTDARAQSEMSALFNAAVDANPGPLAGMLKDPGKRPTFSLHRAGRGVDYLTERYGSAFQTLLALAGLVLLIACANVANLLLAKSAARQREIGLRFAMGARRGRIVRQLLTEGMLLALMAGIAGAMLGYSARNIIPAALGTSWRPNVLSTAVDSKVLLASLAITIFTGILFSLAPAWQARRVELNEALKDGGRSSTSLSKLRLGRLLVALQVALCVLLLAGAGLCVNTFANLSRVPLGFRPQGVLLFNLDPGLRYAADPAIALAQRLRESVGAIPGVESAAFSRSAGEVAVGGRFFETMGIPILAGRGLDERDASNGAPVAVVNQAYARENLHDPDPLGKMTGGSSGSAYRIVGICADWHDERLRDPVYPKLYRPASPAASTHTSADGTAVHRSSTPITFEIKLTSEKPQMLAGVVAQIRSVVHEEDPNLAISDVRTETEQIGTALAEERLMAMLAVVFGSLALLLAAIGIYGVVAYGVARRTNEIGIRVALGARPGGVAWMVLRETLLLVAGGIAAGVGAVVALSPMVDRVLAPGWAHGYAYGVKPGDPLTIVIAALVLSAAALAAGWLPARRAMRVDPMTVLRHE